MFSVVSDCSQGGVVHVAITQDALNLTVQGHQPPPPPPHTHTALLQPQSPPIHTLWARAYPCRVSLLVTSGGQDWRPVQTCSPSKKPYHIRHLKKHMRSAQASGVRPTGMPSCFKIKNNLVRPLCHEQDIWERKFKYRRDDGFG